MLDDSQRHCVEQVNTYYYYISIFYIALNCCLYYSTTNKSKFIGEKTHEMGVGSDYLDGLLAPVAIVVAVVVVTKYL